MHRTSANSPRRSVKALSKGSFYGTCRLRMVKVCAFSRVLRRLSRYPSEVHRRIDWSGRNNKQGLRHLASRSTPKRRVLPHAPVSTGGQKHSRLRARGDLAGTSPQRLSIGARRCRVWGHEAVASLTVPGTWGITKFFTSATYLDTPPPGRRVYPQLRLLS